VNFERQSGTVTFLFTDIEGSTRLWEHEPARMRGALARHDAIARSAVKTHSGIVVKMTGDGVHAAFENPLDAIGAVLQLQDALSDPAATGDVALRVRCGIHAGLVEFRDSDYFGSPVNRAARIMGAAHGGQILLSQAVVDLVHDRLPDAVSLRDLGRVRLRDLASAEHVYQIVHPQMRVDYPALRSLELTPNNLPQQATSFVGREREFAEVKKALRTTRLLTLVGTGGIGKTRLSLQVAADVIDDYPDGVWFVELAALTDPRLVPQAMASVLGVKEDAGHGVNEALTRYVKDRTLLLVLDNCEQVVHVCAELAEALLKSGPHVTILASSREHLHINAETIYPVPALAVPNSHDAIALDALTRYESVRLFVDRAMAARPAFRVTAQNAAAVAEICQRLDGIPLAIELAAARVRALSVQDIAARLKDRFRLLTTGERTALPRQQTLRALIDWSYDLLTLRERELFRRLAVFAGGWTLESAEVVCAGGDLDQGDVLDLLTALIEKSLVAADGEEARYGLLETVREYAQERLSESGEADDVRTRHLAFHLTIAEAARPGLAGPEQAAWLMRLDLERENLLAAHAWCDKARDGGELGLKFVYGIQPYFVHRGVLELGRRVAAQALGRAGAEGRSLARCRALFAAGWLGCYARCYADAQSYLEESHAIAQEHDDKRRMASALQPLALALSGQGDLAKARGHAEKALALEQELGNKHQVVTALNALAQIYRLEANLDRAEPLYEQVVALSREDGKHEGIAVGLLNVAMVSIGRGSADRARGILRDVVPIAAETGSSTVEQSVLEVSAGLASLLKEWERAARFFGAVEARTTHTGLHRDPADEAFLVPLIARAREALGATAFSACELAGSSLSYSQAIAEARAWLGTRS
jgi:predicted ATPase/class 3 adenylate cyclase